MGDSSLVASWLAAAHDTLDADGARGLRPLAVVGALVRQVAPLHPLASAATPVELPLAPPDAVPWLLGPLYESLMGGADRHRQGVHYTPPEVVRGLVGATLLGLAPGPVCDPSVGGAASLLGAGEWLEHEGLQRADIAADLLWGIDVDPAAVLVARAAVETWSGVDPGEHVVCADTLETGSDSFANAPPGGFTAVVGNPPFQNQLTSDTARTAEAGAALRQRLNIAAGAYVDTAALFLVAAVEMVPSGGRVTLVQPHSTLVAAGAAAVRDELLRTAPPIGMWMGGSNVFEASVQTCAPTLQRGAALTTVTRSTGRDVVPAEPITMDPMQLEAAGTWGPLVSDLLGVPPVALAPDANGGTLADWCTATAGFRDQFYGLAGHIVEVSPADPVHASKPALVTVGMIDPLNNRWGTGPFRFAGSRWVAPAVDRASLRAADETLERWVQDRLEPKVLLATQTRVIEAVVDEFGLMVPSTPVVAVTPPAHRLWHLAAVLLAPLSSAWAMHRFGGAALTLDTVKLSAKQVLELPAPADGASWDEGAAAAKAASVATTEEEWSDALDALGEAMAQAYRLGDAAAELNRWWADRRPDFR